AEAPPAERPKGAYDWFAAGVDKEGAGELAPAAGCYRKALDADPGLAAAHSNLGGVAFRQRNMTQASIEFEAALALDPEQPEARYTLPRRLYQKGEAQPSAAELRRVV